jgi:hypothetical protein
MDAARDGPADHMGIVTRSADTMASIIRTIILIIVHTTTATIITRTTTPITTTSKRTALGYYPGRAGRGRISPTITALQA